MPGPKGTGLNCGTRLKPADHKVSLVLSPLQGGYEVERGAFRPAHGPKVHIWVNQP